MRDASLPLTVHEFDEWGDPGTCDAAEAVIRSYCPYENVRSQEYPALMVTASLNDTRSGLTGLLFVFAFVEVYRTREPSPELCDKSTRAHVPER